MTNKAWKRLRYGSVLRRTDASPDFVLGKCYQIGVDVRGTIYPIFPRVPGYTPFDTLGITDPENWELVHSATQEQRRFNQWAKEQMDDLEDAEEP